MKKVCMYSGTALLSLLLVFCALTPAYALEAKVSGQVNHLVLWADDGIDDDFFIADNDNSSTRIRFTGEEAFGAIKAGIQFEIEAERNTSSALTINQNSDGGFNWGDRWLNVYFVTQVGKFDIGKGDSAANNTTEVDLSGTTVINYSDVNATAGGFVWRNSDGTAFRATSATTNLSVGNTRNNFDGELSRAERVRYSTPTFAGFTVSTSVANGDGWDASLWYAAEIYGKLAAAIGYTDTGKRGSDAAENTTLAGSISWLAPFGLNITGAYGVRDFDITTNGRDDATNWYAKVGYKFGIHAVSVEYGMTEDLHTSGDESTNYGVAYVINPWKPVELYATYRFYTLEVDAGNDPEDITVAAVGTRIKF